MFLRGKHFCTIKPRCRSLRDTNILSYYSAWFSYKLFEIFLHWHSFSMCQTFKDINTHSYVFSIMVLLILDSKKGPNLKISETKVHLLQVNSHNSSFICFLNAILTYKSFQRTCIYFLKVAFTSGLKCSYSLVNYF